jgi:hypothetical protein
MQSVLLTKLYGARHIGEKKDAQVPAARANLIAQKTREVLIMSTRFLNIAIISGLLLATAVPAFAADEPKTKADCDKAKGKWDDKTSKCTVKK